MFRSPDPMLNQKSNSSTTTSQTCKIILRSETPLYTCLSFTQSLTHSLTKVGFFCLKLNYTTLHRKFYKTHLFVFCTSFPIIALNPKNCLFVLNSYFLHREKSRAFSSLWTNWNFWSRGSIFPRACEWKNYFRGFKSSNESKNDEKQDLFSMKKVILYNNDHFWFTFFTVKKRLFYSEKKTFLHGKKVNFFFFHNFYGINHEKK